MDELHRCTHADLLGQSRYLAHQKFGDRQGVHLVDIDRFAVMLADVGVTKAELIGEDDLAEVFLVSLGRAGVRAKAVREDAEFHYHSSMKDADAGARSSRHLCMDFVISGSPASPAPAVHTP